ncbi:MAG: FHA domain-containing protein, partial [Chloroflexi bacterium]|nr:FHA domain-containing protein [Chloroflexota bacterium]
MASDQIPFQQWIVSTKEVEIGRGRSSDVCLPHRSVSRLHARVRQAADGFLLEDFGSTNGSFVDGCRVNGTAPLLDGVQVLIGDIALDAKLVEAAQQIVQTPAAPTGADTILVDPPELPLASDCNGPDPVALDAPDQQTPPRGRPRSLDALAPQDPAVPSEAQADSSAAPFELVRTAEELSGRLHVVA